MSKFSINNPAFLSAAGNVQGEKSNPFYIQAIEDDTTVLFKIADFTELSTDGIEYSSAPEIIQLNAGEKCYIRFNTITDVTVLGEGIVPIFSVDKKYNLGGEFLPLYFEGEHEGETFNLSLFACFYNDASLVDASKLDIKFIDNMMLSVPIFYGCTSLVSPPKLPNTTFIDEGYQALFKNCISLVNAPELPAPILSSYCYKSMFEGCSSLEKIVCLATDLSAESCLDNWVIGVATSGVFVKAPGVEWPTGDSGIPEGWTVEEYAG